MESNVLTRLNRVAARQTVTLTHYGRKSGKPYDVTIRFVVEGDKVYIGTANVNRQWVRNVQKTPQVKLSIGGETFNGTARFLTDRAEHQRAMAAIRKKYWMYRPIIALGQVLRSDARQDGSVRGRVGGIESNSKAYLKQLEFCSR
jgi:deazaflavin-dependent oxidoreductase (nitroreductase family)